MSIIFEIDPNQVWVGKSEFGDYRVTEWDGGIQIFKEFKMIASPPTLEMAFTFIESYILMDRAREMEVMEKHNFNEKA